MALSGFAPNSSKSVASIPAASSSRRSAAGVTGIDDAGVGDEQRAAEPELAGELAERARLCP